MKSSPLATKYLNPGVESVSMAVENAASILVDPTTMGEDGIAITFGNKSVTFEQRKILFDEIASIFQSRKDSLFFDISFASGKEVWTVTLRSISLPTLVVQFDESISEACPSSQRFCGILNRAASQGSIDVLFDPQKNRYEGQSGVLYFFLKLKNRKRALSNAIDASSAKFGNTFLPFLRSFRGVVVLDGRQVSRFIVDFENSLDKSKVNVWEDFLNEIGVDPQLWWE